ncbi:MAG: hypothetical protein IJZ20_06735, partial [Clostridia bacterium]|nr:hypothetical protein [Clostridia bacterium]
APVAGGKVDYSIIPVAKVTVTPDTVTPDENRFMFNFKGKDLAVIGGADTAKEIVIGQVKVAGYGKYTFAVNTDATATNIAHATTISDNIVDTFVPNGSIAAGKGTLDLDEATTGEQEIAVPTRKLTINIDFPNSVDNKTMLYQDMTVTVSGGDLADAIVVELGNDADNTTVTFDGAYQVILDKKLTKSIAYNVTVEGAGYRTARYTVTMTEDKTVNFWNNVKDNETAVEEGKAYATSNFLAGDIVGDNEINIYDLSAVVSYFATVIDDEDMYERYVKYDLNRDGLIDSKDVAYVLVSWGN